MGRDIFVDMRSKLGCEYISGLPFLKEQVEKAILDFSLKEYSEEQIFDFCEYVFESNDSVWQFVKKKTQQWFSDMEYLSSIDRSSYIIAVYIKNGENGKLVPQVIAEKNDGKKYGELQQIKNFTKYTKRGWQSCLETATLATDRQTDRQTDSK